VIIFDLFAIVEKNSQVWIGLGWNFFINFNTG